MADMRVLVAGASGAVGRALVPALLGRGHKVAGLVRSEAGGAFVASQGAQPFVVDALDATAVSACFDRFRPDAVVHQLTALPDATDLRDFDRVFAQTNALRTRGTDNLVAAARRGGVRRFVAQSFCGWPYARVGGPVKTEDDPLDPNPPAALRRTLDAIRHLEGAVTAATDLHGVSLRYGGFYGPGTSLSLGGAIIEQVRRRRFPVVGAGAGIWSFLHIADTASATVAALEGEATGVFNVVDDEPAPVADWLPALAAAVGAKRPWHLPALLGRLVLPEHLFVMMTDIRGGSNARLKRTFVWRPAWPTWREGFQRGLGEPRPAHA
jgi:nucleoside-diphosphate-sugar epimerase